jgi:hypothetical protein
MDRENHLMKELRITITNEQAMLVEGLADKIEAGKKAGIELVVEIARQRLEGGHYDLTSIAAPKLYPSVPDSAETQTTPPVSSRWLDKEETAASSGPSGCARQSSASIIRHRRVRRLRGTKDPGPASLGGSTTRDSFPHSHLQSNRTDPGTV